MSFVVTLISNPAKPAVTENLIEKISALLPAAPQVKHLNPQIAVDLTVEGHAPSEELASSIRTNLADAPVDVFIQPQNGRRKKLLIADMDSTMIQQECIDELAAELGLKEKKSPRSPSVPCAARSNLNQPARARRSSERPGHRDHRQNH